MLGETKLLDNDKQNGGKVLNSPQIITKHSKAPASTMYLSVSYSQTVQYAIVLFKMFSRQFFAKKKLIITLRTSKFGNVTQNVMIYFLHAMFDTTHHTQT